MEQPPVVREKNLLDGLSVATSAPIKLRLLIALMSNNSLASGQKPTVLMNAIFQPRERPPKIDGVAFFLWPWMNGYATAT